jgi:hypothetical protein
VTGALTEMREELKAALTGRVLADNIALVVQDVLPEACQPPALLIEPGDPFLTPAKPAPRGIGNAQWNVTALLGHHTNPAILPALELLLEQVLDAIFANTNDWTLVSATGPAQIELGPNATFPGVRVTVTRLAHIITPEETP